MKELKKPKVVEKKSEKALASAAKNCKAITSFFTKKPTPNAANTTE